PLTPSGVKATAPTSITRSRAGSRPVVSRSRAAYSGKADPILRVARTLAGAGSERRLLYFVRDADRGDRSTQANRRPARKARPRRQPAASDARLLRPAE